MVSQSDVIYYIYCFDEHNQYTSQSVDWCIDLGGICAKTVDHSVSGQQAGCISVFNNNSTYIARMTIQQFDGTRDSVRIGDTGYACDQFLYNSMKPKNTFDSTHPRQTRSAGN